MSDDGQTTACEHAETPDEKAMCEPRAYSTMLEAYGKESGYSTRENRAIDSAMEVRENLERRMTLGIGMDCYRKETTKVNQKGQSL